MTFLLPVGNHDSDPFEKPWPKEHKGHRWSGWPGAICLRCGSEDYAEYGLANNLLDPATGEWVSESDKLAYQASLICPADTESNVADHRD